MNALRLLPVILSLLVLAAHFFRAGNTVTVAAVLVLLPLLMLRRRWVAWLVQAVLVLGALEWVRATVGFVRMRQAMDMPWTRLAVILGAVAAFTLLSTLVFFLRPLRWRYHLGAANPPAKDASSPVKGADPPGKD